MNERLDRHRGRRHGPPPSSLHPATRWLVALLVIPAVAALTTVIWSGGDGASFLHAALTVIALYFPLLVVLLTASAVVDRFIMMRLAGLAFVLSVVITVLGGVPWISFVLWVVGFAAAAVAMIRAPRW
jgi:hypothetical protein